MQALNGPLSPRERQVIQLLANDMTQKSIQRELHISQSCVKYYTASIRQKLRCYTMTGCVAKWLREGNDA